MNAEEIIQAKEFHELTEKEFQLVKELAENEEDYRSMKSFFSLLAPVASSNQEVVSTDIKKSLDAVFQSKFPGIQKPWVAPENDIPVAAKVIPFYNRPLVRVAAVFLIGCAVVPFLLTKLENDQDPKYAMENGNESKVTEFKTPEPTEEKEDTDGILDKTISYGSGSMTFKMKQSENDNSILDHPEVILASVTNKPNAESPARTDDYYKQIGMDADLNPMENKNMLSAQAIEGESVLNFLTPAF